MFQPLKEPDGFTLFEFTQMPIGLGTESQSSSCRSLVLPSKCRLLKCQHPAELELWKGSGEWPLIKDKGKWKADVGCLSEIFPYLPPHTTWKLGEKPRPTFIQLCIFNSCLVYAAIWSRPTTTWMVGLIISPLCDLVGVIFDFHNKGLIRIISEDVWSLRAENSWFLSLCFLTPIFSYL